MYKSVKPYRHGDLRIKQIDKLPLGKKSKVKSFVLAHGESGHRHLLQVIGGDGYIVMLEPQKDNPKRYFEVEGPTRLTHEEHNTITIQPGIYEVENEQEFDYFTEEIKRVID